jgi:hypothetical protein
MNTLQVEGILSLEYGSLSVTTADRKQDLHQLFRQHFFPGQPRTSPTIWRIDGDNLEVGRMSVTFEAIDGLKLMLSLEGICGVDDYFNELYIEGSTTSGLIASLVIDHFWQDDFPCEYEDIEDCEVDLGAFRIRFEPLEES